MLFLAPFLLLLSPALAAPFHPLLPPSGSLVTSRYIVQLKPGSSLSTHAVHLNSLLPRSRSAAKSSLAAIDPANRTAVDAGSLGAGSTIDRSFNIAGFAGYTATFDAHTAQEIAAMQDVLHIEPDLIYTLADAEAPPIQDATTEGEATDTAAVATQPAAPWHLGDISHAGAGANEYIYATAAGAGTRVYVVDTGVRRSHAEFAGRVEWGINGVTGSTDDPGESAADTNGHGTHVAALVAGATYGVAKRATVVDVKVFDYSTTSMSALLTGLEWAVNDIISRGGQNTSVINLSLSAPVSESAPPTAVEMAIKAAHAQGILITAAAGNNDGPVAGVSPSRIAEVLSVGMTDRGRARASFIAGVYGSNYGAGVALFAPGAGIASASHLKDDGAALRTGTSMAAPLVAAVAAVVMSQQGGESGVAVGERVLAMGLKGVVGDVRGSANVLLNNGMGV